MGIPESEWSIIWEGIDHHRRTNNTSLQHFSMQMAGVPTYTKDKTLRGLQDGSEEVTEELVRHCALIFGFVSARQIGSGVNVSVEECIEFLTAPVKKNMGQGKLQL